MKNPKRPGRPPEEPERGRKQMATLRLSVEDLRLLDEVRALWSLNRSDAIRRAIRWIHEREVP